MDMYRIKEKIKEDGSRIIGEDREYRRYSVMIPIFYNEGDPCVLFEVRAKHLRNQPGEISFPGGRIEAGESNEAAAIRETCEELGLQSGDIEVFGQTAVLITHHNKIIYPFVGVIKDIDKINPSKDEVDHIFYVPLKFFRENAPVIKKISLKAQVEEEFPYSDEIDISYRMAHGSSNIYFYRYNDYVIWGLTAKILNHFINLIDKE